MASPLHEDAPQTWEQIREFWVENLATGAIWKRGVFDVPPDPAVREEVPDHYDVGKIVRGYTDAWLGVAPNHATPIELVDLLVALDEVTSQLEQKMNERRFTERDLPPCPEDPICRDLQRWRRRLDGYMLAVGAVPGSESGDRRLVLWEVTAPLFLGYYGGPTGSEIPLDPAAFPPGFDTRFQHLPDIAAPYSLANQLDIEIAWEDERTRRLVRDIVNPVTTGAAGLLTLAAIGLGIAVGVKLLQKR